MDRWLRLIFPNSIARLFQSGDAEPIFIIIVTSRLAGPSQGFCRLGRAFARMAQWNDQRSGAIQPAVAA